MFKNTTTSWEVTITFFLSALCASANTRSLHCFHAHTSVTSPSLYSSNISHDPSRFTRGLKLAFIFHSLRFSIRSFSGSSWGHVIMIFHLFKKIVHSAFVISLGLNLSQVLFTSFYILFDGLLSTAQSFFTSLHHSYSALGPLSNYRTLFVP